MTIPKNLEVARKAKLAPLEDIAASIGIGKHLLEPYGEGVAKIKLDAIEELEDRPRAKYVVVSAITPTPLGEGKTTTTVGLQQVLPYAYGGSDILQRRELRLAGNLEVLRYRHAGKLLVLTLQGHHVASTRSSISRRHASVFPTSLKV